MASEPERVQEVFLAAVEKDGDERARLLDRECGSDVELRQQVQALLRAHDDPGSFLDDIPSEAPPTIDQPIRVPRRNLRHIEL